MNKSILRPFVAMIIIASSFFCCMSCGSDADAPSIDGVWNNTESVPVEQIHGVYPGQTICLHGTGFSSLQQIVINNISVGITNTEIYDTDNFITFNIPDSVVSTAVSGLKLIKVVTANGAATYDEFLVKAKSEKPSISSVSATTLVAGSTLQIKGANLEGAQTAYLPLTFEQSIQCQLDTTQVSDASNVYIIVPQNVNFASGQLKIVMQKTDSISSTTYTENVYSKTINFKN
jgi:hypothetical protein